MEDLNIKGVKKVRSAIHHRISKHVKQNIAEYFVFSKHKWFLVILYNVCNSQSYIFLRNGILKVLKHSLFFFFFCDIHDICVLF